MMEFARKFQIALAALSRVTLSTVIQRNQLNYRRQSGLFAINSFCYAIAV